MGNVIRSYGQYCPLAKASEVLGDRWTLLIVSELIAGAERFNDLARGLPRISRPLLAQRLRGLERAGVIEKRSGSTARSSSYHLTAAGEELGPLIRGLAEWGARWAFGEPEPDELDPILLLWWMRRRVNHDALPAQRVVIRFDFRQGKGTYWLILKTDDVSVCLQDPGFELDLAVHADLAALFEVWLGRTTLQEANAAGTVRVEGAPARTRALPSWLALAPIADAVRASHPVGKVTPSPRVAAVGRAHSAPGCGASAEFPLGPAQSSS